MIFLTKNRLKRGPLRATVTNSQGTVFTVNNRIAKSNGDIVEVSAIVRNSSGTPFTVFR